MAGTAGCVDRLRSLTSRTGTTQVGFEIKTLPADEDPFAMRLARRIAAWFDAAGLAVSVLPVTGDELLRQVLITKDFDAFLARFPGRMDDPDGLYGLAHSNYAAEPGWQNPFGYTSMTTDEALERQRTADGEQRREAVASAHETLLAENPFSVLCFPDRVTAVREDRFEGLTAVDLRDPRSYFDVAGDDATLRLATTDYRAMTNLNPLNPEYRRDGLVTGFLYEPLVDGIDGRDWLAESVTVTVDDDRPSARVTLREGLTWHDDVALTAEDVAFTYRLLADTALETEGDRRPSTRFRGRSSLVDSVDATGKQSLRIDFTECSPTVAARALTVPILPEHVWRDRTSGQGTGPAGTTTAVVTDNLPPVGSGPLAFETARERERLVLSRFEDHFTLGSSPPDGVEGGLAFEELVVSFASSDAAAVELVATGDVDATIAPLGADVVPRIGRHDEMTLDVTPTGSFYFLGFDTTEPPLSNVQLRGLLAHLIDREYLVANTFDGYATPAESPLAASEWVPPAFEWDGTAHAAPFYGSDGEVAVERAREAFREAGYRYDDRGRVRRN